MLPWMKRMATTYKIPCARKESVKEHWTVNLLSPTRLVIMTEMSQTRAERGKISGYERRAEKNTNCMPSTLRGKLTSRVLQHKLAPHRPKTLHLLHKLRLLSDNGARRIMWAVDKPNPNSIN